MGQPNATDLKLCIDRVVPDEEIPEVLRIRAQAAEDAQVAAGLLGGNGSIEDAKAQLGVVRAKMWPNGQVLRCRFLDGEPSVHERVIANAKQWEAFANVTLEFGDSPDAEIRISFSEPGSWSAVGTDALIRSFFPRNQPTMNYGWLTPDSTDAEVERVVVHEFGHALGCIHEHQQPAADLKWNREEVYRVFSGSPNFWTRAQIDHNIFNRYDSEQVNHTQFDGASIMLYGFPGRLFTDGVGTQSNTKLSEQDKSFIAVVYPKPSQPPTTGRTLRLMTPRMRGDDVRQVQANLNEVNAGPIEEDGIYGPASARAVKRFQTAHGLTADGIYGPRTRRAMELVLSAAPAPR
jgi:serralysin